MSISGLMLLTSMGIKGRKVVLSVEGLLLEPLSSFVVYIKFLFLATQQQSIEDNSDVKDCDSLRVVIGDCTYIVLRILVSAGDIFTESVCFILIKRYIELVYSVNLFF